MKKTIVCMLLALSVSSSLYSPQIVIAAEQSEETLEEHSNAGASDDADNSKDDQTTQTEQAPKEDTTTKAEQTPQQEQPTKTEETQSEEPIQSEEETQFSITVNENLDILRKKLVTPFNEQITSGRYLLSEDLIFVGYVDSTRGEEGFVVPSITKTADKVSSISFGEYSDNGEYKWGYIRTNDSLSDIKSLSEYIKKNTGEIQIASHKDLISFPLKTEAPTTVLVFTPQGDYLGNMDVNSTEVAHALYDGTFLETPSIKISSSLTEDKTQAEVSVSYDFSHYPDQLGGEYLMNFDVKDSKGNLVLSSEEALKKYIDTGNTVKGVTRVFPVSMNGTFTLSMRTNVRTITSDFKINGVSSPKQEEISTVKPEISYSELPNGILTGTNYPLTVYSSIDSVLMLNGESSQTACKEYTFSVSHNGKYKITAITSSGVEVSKTIEVTGFVDKAEEINMDMYGTGGTTLLPQTGGVSWVAITLSGVLLIIGGTILSCKDKILALSAQFKERRWHNED